MPAMADESVIVRCAVSCCATLHHAVHAVPCRAGEGKFGCARCTRCTYQPLLLLGGFQGSLQLPIPPHTPPTSRPSPQTAAATAQSSWEGRPWSRLPPGRTSALRSWAEPSCTAPPAVRAWGPPATASPLPRRSVAPAAAASPPPAAVSLARRLCRCAACLLLVPRSRRTVAAETTAFNQAGRPVGPPAPRPPAGVTDHLAENEPHALSLARSILRHLNTPAHPAAGAPWAGAAAAGATAGGGGGGWEEPRFPPEELKGGPGPCVCTAHAPWVSVSMQGDEALAEGRCNSSPPGVPPTHHALVQHRWPCALPPRPAAQG